MKASDNSPRLGEQGVRNSREGIREKEDQTSPPLQMNDVLGLIKSITHSVHINEFGRQVYGIQ